ncbi:ATP-binding protein [Oceaniglobus roseus]|uniref:ATP-binding protein n=1 Tax=Oceaniglobus roseus TaxID=1737570 RepID=UPI001FE8E569|nr:ATP-binding protein [Kandeliimicrobium roseum]
MTDILSSLPTASHIFRAPRGRTIALFGVAVVLGVLGTLLFESRYRPVLWFVALTLLLLGAMIEGQGLLRRWRRLRRTEVLDPVIRPDPAPVVITDLGGLIEQVNPVAAAGLNARRGTALSDLMLHHVAVPTPLLQRLLAAALAEGQGEDLLPGADGGRRVSVVRVDDDALLWRFDPVPLPVPVVPDVPAEAAAPHTEAVENLVDEVFDALPIPILRIDREGLIDRASHRARRLLEDDQIVGKSLSRVVEGLGRPIGEWLKDAFDGRGQQRPEVARTTAGSHELYLQITLDSLDLDPREHLVAVLHDATELKTLEAQFVQSQKMQAIGQLAGGVAHDFNNLLTAISGHCDLLLLRRDEADPDFADLEQINQNANRAASLVGQLLAFSRKQNLRPEYLDLRQTLSELTHLLNRLVGERIQLTLSLDPALQLVRADKRQLEQVIMNLVVNARDAMPNGGQIRIVTEVEVLKSALLRDRVELPAGPYVKVRVIDEGTGIAPEQLPKIFEPFFTTKKTGEGTGLGLSTAYGIVKQTGGYIFADSTPGEGSCFSLYFPAHAAESGAAVQKRPVIEKSSAQLGAGVVLLVEDEPPVRAFASRALRLRGYTVLEAENGEDALEILSDPAISVDIFVTDVIMPGLDGPSWVRLAMKDRPETRVIFISGYSEENLSEAQLTIPHSTFLPKPFSLSQLTTTVQRQIGAMT